MTATALTSVIVVSHDSGALLHRCVTSVLAQDADLELIVVDNASSDGSLQALPQDARLRVLRNADNRGFAVACNQGAAHAHGGRLLFLNPDCVMSPDAVSRLLAVLDANPGIGVLGAQLLNEDGSEQAASRRATPSPLRALRLALGLPALPAHARVATDAGEELRRPVENGLRVESFVAPAVAPAWEPVDAISGALMLLPRTVFDRLGGFDPGYVLHCEDLDLCRRALQHGHQVALATAVRVTHAKGTSSRRRPVWVEWQKHRGMLRYFRRFDAAQSPWWLRTMVPLGVWLRFPLAALRALLRARLAQRGQR